MISTDLLRRAFIARAEGELGEFLVDFPSDEQDRIRRAVTPGLAYPKTNSPSIITKVTPSIKHDPSDLASTWMTHKDWMSNGPYSLPYKAVSQISDSTRDICAAINASETDRNYGLVVGYVQSGKTANYTALLSRAVDMGYTFIIVLSGILNDLREQTQRRLMRDLLGDPHEKLDIEHIDTTEMTQFIQITSIENDFTGYQAMELPRIIEGPNRAGKPIIAVMKKNVNVLEHLLDGLKRVGPSRLASERVLIIDDEADHATTNTGGEGEDHVDHEFDADDEEEEDYLKQSNPTRTNKRIREIIKSFQKSTYIGYTATPFANVLINPNSKDQVYGKTLYPRDFIIALPEPDGYFGSEKFFGKEGDPLDERKHTEIVTTEEEELAFKMQLDEDSTREENVPQSLKIAMMDFILTGLIKKIRRDSGISVTKHHTMLIHIQWRNDDQSKTAEAVRRLFDEWKELAETSLMGPEVREFRQSLRKRWEAEYRANSSTETWSQIDEQLTASEEEGGWMSSVEIRMINSLDSDEKLDYDAHQSGLNVIAIGGNKLSRGLTLEGLTTSYFLRRTKMYDSLLQMGRWFGYRHGYEDLVRVHSTKELLAWFQWLVEVESHIRDDISRYEVLNMTPEELSIRIPIHSEMKITSSSKMKNAVRSISDYQGYHMQTIRLPVHDQTRLKKNLDVTSKFLNSLERGTPYEPRMWGWRNVDSTIVADYIENLDIDGPPHAVFDKHAISRYLRNKHADDKVFVAHTGSSDVAGLSQGPGEVPSGDPGWDFGTRYVARSQGYEVISGERRGTGNLKVISEPKDVELCEQLNPGGLHMRIYLIAPGSKPRDTSKREALPNHGTPIVGLSIKFPNTQMEASIRAYAHTRGVRGDV